MTWRVVALLAASGCYNPAYQDCALSCATSGVCPSGLECVAGVCRSMSGACGAGSADAMEQVGTWKFRKKLTLGRPPMETLTDFPLLVRRALDADLANFAQPDGGDLKFTTIDGMPLAHEIERFVDGTGEVVAWVRVPSLPAAGATELFMYYGNLDTPNLQRPADVWDTSYIGVWHLSDPPGAMLNDSSPNAADGTKSSTSGPAPVAGGHIAGAHGFRAAMAADHFSIGNDAAKVASSVYTFEAWLYPNATTATAYRSLLDIPVTFNAQPKIGYADNSFQPGVRQHSIVVGAANSTMAMSTPTDSAPASAWLHVAVIASGNPLGAKVYINGTLQTVANASSYFAQDNTTVVIGGQPNMAGASIDGTLDEIRLSRVERSAAYIQASFFNQGSEVFVTFGAPEVVP